MYYSNISKVSNFDGHVGLKAQENRDLMKILRTSFTVLSYSNNKDAL